MSFATSAKLYTYDGKSLSLKDWSAELGIRQVTLCQRLRKGWPVSMVFGLSVDETKAGKQGVYTYNGRTATASEWAKITGVPEVTLHYRLTHRKQWTLEKALTTPYCPRKGAHPTELTFKGKTMSVADWARKLGLRDGTVRMRLYRGASVEDILNPTVMASQIRKPLNVTFKGETHNLREWSGITGISFQCLSQRMHSGWKLEDVFLKPVAKVVAKKYLFRGQRKTILEWAKEFGLDESVVRSRLMQGWPIKRALTTPKGARQGRAAARVALKGERKTIAEWAAASDIPESVVRSRLAQGWELEKALKIPVRKHSESKKVKKATRWSLLPKDDA